MLRSRIEEILSEQSEYLKIESRFTERRIRNQINFLPGFVAIITGVRRSGKSTLLKSMIAQLDNTTNSQYLLFDDPRLIDFTVEDFYTIEDLSPSPCHYYYDEIHQIDNWEKYIRQANERKIPLVITGSNATMFSTELATLLTGRHLSYELFPFDFQEYCQFHNLSVDQENLQAYLDEGGFPEYQKSKNPIILRQLLIDIIQRDIVARYSLRDSYPILQIATHLFNNISRPYTLSKLTKTYNIGSVNTVAAYMRHLENAYLLFSINKYDHSYKKQMINEKKIYAVDTGFVKANTLKGQEDRGRIFENLIFLQFRRNYSNVFYFKKNGECDFVTSDSVGSKNCYQVTWRLDRHNEEREVKGLLEAMKYLDLDCGTIITWDQQDSLKTQGKSIKIVSALELMGT